MKGVETGEGEPVKYVITVFLNRFNTKLVLM